MSGYYTNNVDGHGYIHGHEDHHCAPDCDGRLAESRESEEPKVHRCKSPHMLCAHAAHGNDVGWTVVAAESRGNAEDPYDKADADALLPYTVECCNPPCEEGFTCDLHL